jgi:Ca2+-binding EF-hand superfamily protein
MNFLSTWKPIFDRFDTDKSGFIDLPTFHEAIVAFGYRLSKGMVMELFQSFDEPNGDENRMMAFDRFIVTCVVLKRLTDTFKIFDHDRDGYITISLYGTLPLLHASFHNGLLLTFLLARSG